MLCRIICILFAMAFVHGVKIHEHMTADVIAKILKTTPDNIPEYDVVTLRHNLYKRSSSNLRLEFNAFGENIEAYLQPPDGILAGQNTPVWFASTQPNGTVEYKKMPGDTMGAIVKTFISISDQNTIMAFMPEGEKVSFTGYINAMKIMPLPKDIWELMKAKGEASAPKASRSLLDTHHHLIIKTISLMNESDMLTQLERKNETRTLSETNHSKLKRSMSDIIYPSILVSTDIAPSNTIEANFAHYDEIIYQLAFWNAVDLRFRHVENPKIRLQIAGIIIALDRGATPYAHKYRKGDEIILPDDFSDPDDYWSAMTKHPDFPPEAYDIVATVTDNHMMYMEKGNERGIVGLSIMGSLCLRSSLKFYANTIITDKGGFGGVLPAAHELGHIFGLDHDPKTGDECDHSHYHIMHATNTRGPKSLEWSPCSLRMLSHFLRKDKIDCVDQQDEFHAPGIPVKRLLPGDIVNTDKQCQDRGYHWACATSSKTCTNMECYYSGWRVLGDGWWCKETGPAVEGTTCSPHHKCLDGVCQCVSEECASKNN